MPSEIKRLRCRLNLAGRHGADDGEGDGAWFIALALAVLRRRSAVIDGFGLLERLWWVREGRDADGGED